MSAARLGHARTLNSVKSRHRLGKLRTVRVIRTLRAVTESDLKLTTADDASTKSIHVTDNGAVESVGQGQVGPVLADTTQQQHVASGATQLVISRLSTGDVNMLNSRPYMLYLPDLDGQGLTSKRQWAALTAEFDFWNLTIPPEDRSSFAAVVQHVKAHLEASLADAPPERPLYLMGEGMGALVAVAAALECSSLIDRVLLVNPATSYEGSNLARAGPLLASLPQQLYQSLPLALGPALLNPLSFASKFLPAADPLALMRQGPQGLAQLVPGAAEGLLTVMGDVAQLVASLPPDTLRWRLGMVEEGARFVNPRLSKLSQRTAVLLGADDVVLPSGEQKKKLEEQLQRSFVQVLEGRGHAMLAEGGVDLLSLLREDGFLVQRREFSSPVRRREEAAAIGVAGPIELPSPKELDRICRLFLNQRLRQVASPIFLSTSEDGGLVEGLGAIPTDERPLLFVGNHQLYALDMYVMVEEMLREKKVLPRGLAHPTLFGETPQVPAGEDPNASPNFLNPQQPNFMKALLQTYGAVEVSPTSFYRLMRQGEAVLLYPGGVREGFKRKGEAYRVFWPNKSEFVRMAARFGATIVPFAGIGVDDSLEILLDYNDILALPILGDRARKASAKVPNARAAVVQEEAVDETYIAPVIAPTVPKRMYFLFQKPIRLSPADAKNKEKCNQVYADVKASVEDGMAYLLRMREQDPYRDFLTRMVYENPLGQPKRKAPSFEIEQQVTAPTRKGTDA